MSGSIKASITANWGLSWARAVVIAAAAILSLGLAGCAGKTTPPGASFVYGNLVMPEGFGASYQVLYWKEGLSIILVDNIDGGHSSNGSGSTGDPVWRGSGSARAADGRMLSWRVETSDGKTARFFIDEQEYDPAKGGLFLIRVTGGQAQVRQQQRELAGRCTDDDSCQPFLKNDPVVAQFIQETLRSAGK